MSNQDHRSHFKTDETARLASLQRYSILDSAPEKIYDDVTHLAAMICGAPISTITFIDNERQWFKSAVGLQSRGGPREHSFCAHTIDTPITLIVRDAQEDPRFADNPLVTGEPGIRFYAGAPIITPEGNVLGTVCVIDTRPRTLTPIQITSLESLARHTMQLLETRQDVHSYS
jgi:two-component system, NtrC family, sensor kinase